jgi:hypothetical protein
MFLTSSLDGGKWSASRPGRFTPGERPCGTHRIGGWVGLRAGLDAVVKRKKFCLGRSVRWSVTIPTELPRHKSSEIQSCKWSYWCMLCRGLYAF